ncbi:phenylacetate--CoA ligase family protein [Mycolicibacterium fluoranthenivorans]|uniref:phenylacetate--CoA ligase family protein n=1 Tax=Mycolicibacterium fluoranthenivorans TaxID=258505 RepID=UPI001F2DC303|nr:phenylacetate--CoA ligase family protein [Mycolicibacterium fluoranthenivorans]
MASQPQSVATAETAAAHGERYFYEPEIETASREEIRAAQEKRILEMIPYVWERSGFYRDLWSRAGVSPDDIRSLDDFRAKIPTCCKDDLKAYRERTGDPFAGVLCVERSELTSITSTSGTTSLPEFLPEIWDAAWPLPITSTRALWEMGLRPGDRALVPAGSFRGFWDDYARLLGLVPVYIDGWIGEGERVLNAIKRHQVNYFQMFMPTVMEFEALEAKYDIRDMLSSLKGAAFAGQPLSATLERKVREEWGVNLFTWTSAGDTGGAWEGQEHDGYFIQEDTALIEVVDPVTGQPVGDLETGEVIATDLDNNAAPYIRFRSEDLVKVTHQPAASGRTQMRIWVVGRAGDEMRIAGKSFVIKDIWDPVESLPECGDALFQIIRYAPEMDELRIRIGYSPEKTTDVDELRSRAVALLEQKLGVTSRVDLLTVDDILKTSSSVAKFPRTVKA